MCDGVRAAPEPGLSGEHRPDPDTGSGGSEHYRVITDICINDISVTQQQQKFVWAVFWEWRLDYARAGELRAGAWDTRPHSGVAGGHHRPIGRCRSDNSGSISRFCHKHAAASHVGGGTENWRLAGHTGLRLRAGGWGHLPRPVSQHHHHHYHHYRHRQVIIRTTSPPLLRETSCLCLTLTGDFTQYSKSQMLTFWESCLMSRTSRRNLTWPGTWTWAWQFRTIHIYS